MVHADIEQRLHSELYKLVLYVERLRQELADTLRKDGEGTKFDNISAQLDALVKNTETASNEILTSTESILEVVDKLRENDSEEDRNNLCDQIEAHATNTLQACSFQDIRDNVSQKYCGPLNSWKTESAKWPKSMEKHRLNP